MLISSKLFIPCWYQVPNHARGILQNERAKDENVERVSLLPWSIISPNKRMHDPLHCCQAARTMPMLLHHPRSSWTGWETKIYLIECRGKRSDKSERIDEVQSFVDHHDFAKHFKRGRRRKMHKRWCLPLSSCSPFRRRDRRRMRRTIIRVPIEIDIDIDIDIDRERKREREERREREE